MVIIELLKGKYIDSGILEAELAGTDITILTEFLDNWDNIKDFYKLYYPQYPKVVLCGINPGRLGAGKTGIPFIDFKSLSELLDGPDRDDIYKAKYVEVLQQFIE